MTDEEVKKWLNEIIEQDIDFEGMGEDDVDKAKEALKTSIKLLEEKENTISITERITKDCISREAVIERINKQRKGLNPNVFSQDKIGDCAYEICIDFIKRIPSVTPQPKVGKWIKTYEPNDAEPFILWKCSECQNVGCGKRTKYCPNCGAYMAESEE